MPRVPRCSRCSGNPRAPRVHRAWTTFASTGLCGAHTIDISAITGDGDDTGHSATSLASHAYAERDEERGCRGGRMLCLELRHQDREHRE